MNSRGWARGNIGFEFARVGEREEKQSVMKCLWSKKQKNAPPITTEDISQNTLDISSNLGKILDLSNNRIKNTEHDTTDLSNSRIKNTEDDVSDVSNNRIKIYRR